MFPWLARALHAVCPMTIHCLTLRVPSGHARKAGRVAVLHCHLHPSTPSPGRLIIIPFEKKSPPYDAAIDLLFSDSSGTITFDEFKSVFTATLGADALPFNFDWYALLASTE